MTYCAEQSCSAARILFVIGSSRSSSASLPALRFSDLSANRLFWDELTGESWDLFFAGYYAYGGYGDAHPICVDPNPLREGAWHFSPSRFREFLRDIESAMHTSGLKDDGASAGKPISPASWSTAANPTGASLRSVGLLGRLASHGAPTVGNVIEGLRRWQQEEPDTELAPEAFHQGRSLSARPCGSRLDGAQRRWLAAFWATALTPSWIISSGRRGKPGSPPAISGRSSFAL